MNDRSPYSYFGTSPETGGTGVTWSVALATTNTGATLSNPAGSGYNLIVTQATYVLSAVPAAIAAVGLFTGYAAGGITVHTTAGTVQTSRIGDTENAVGLYDRACTLVGTPRWYRPMGTYLYVATPANQLDTFPMLVVNFAPKEIVIPPGGYIGIGTSVATVGFGSISWYEEQRTS